MSPERQRVMETFKPVPVASPDRGRALFWLRCVFDLQLLTIFRFLKTRLPSWRGEVLDVGAGEAPWRPLLGKEATYVGLDIESADGFGMQRDSGITYYDGGRMPFGDATFDQVLCVEVLDHVPEPDAVLAEIARVLRPGGGLALTMPWSARMHHVPYDYARYTHYGLARLLEAQGFEQVCIQPRGNDYAAIANKLIVATLRQLRPAGVKTILSAVWFIVLCPFTLLALATAHLSLWLGEGSHDDPLGWAVSARRATGDGRNRLDSCKEANA